MLPTHLYGVEPGPLTRTCTVPALNQFCLLSTEYVPRHCGLLYRSFGYNQFY